MYGENLYWLEKIPDESIDLIITDPPFNSNRTYNLIYNKKESKAQFNAYNDTWSWSRKIDKTYKDIIANKYNTTAQVITTIKSLKDMLGTGSITGTMLSYLVFMTPRIIEMHRVLKKTGVMYLHIDPTAVHYLKIIIDAVFGINNFRNEIIWHYTKMGNATKNWMQNHDIILFYTKTNNYFFNPQYYPNTSSALKQRFIKDIGPDDTLRWKDIKNKKQQLLDSYISSTKKKLGKTTLNDDDIIIDFRLLKKANKKVDNVFNDIPRLPGNAKERTGRDTQKPIALFERFALASSKEGDMILDPFGGCGTTAVVAEKLNREWIIIDLAYEGIEVTKQRIIKEIKNGKEVKYTEYEQPQGMKGAIHMAKEAKSEFQKFIIIKAGGVPNKKMSGDRGIDGILFFNDGDKIKKAIIQETVNKSVNPAKVRDFMGTMIAEKADMGVFITMEDATKGMKDVANEMGVYIDSFGNEYPKMQFLTVSAIIDDKKKPDVPQIRKIGWISEQK